MRRAIRVGRRPYNPAVYLAGRVLRGLLLLSLVGVGVARGEEPPTGARLQAAAERLEVVLAELEALEQRWIERDEAESAESSARLDEVAILEAELAAAERRSPEVDQIYDVVNPLVRWSVDEVRAAIEAAAAPSELPDRTRRDLSELAAVSAFGAGGGELAGSESIERLEELVSRARETGSRLGALELELRQADVLRDTRLASRIYRLRLAALQNLSAERRLAVHSWGGEAPEAIRLEREVLETVSELQWFRLRSSLAVTMLEFRGFLAPLLAGRFLLSFLAVILVWRWLQRERPLFLRALRERAEAIEEPERRRWASRSVSFLEALAPWGIYIAALAPLGWVLGRQLDDVPLWQPVLMIALFYGFYRLAVDLGVGGVAASIESVGLEETSELEDRVLVGVRWVMRFATVLAFVLWYYSLRLGEGVIYQKVQLIGLAVSGLALLVVVLGFRREVREIFLSLRAHGRLADLVRESAGRWSSYLVTPLAFVWLCGRGVIGLFRGLSFGFERTRTATAYFSRRRMTKIAEHRGYSEGALEALPNEVVRALDERLSAEDLEATGGLPGLGAALASADSWREGAAGGSLLLAGEEGLGKRAWVERFLSLQEGGVRLRLGERMLSAGKLRSWLAASLLPEGASSPSQDQLIEAISAGPRRIVTLEGAENLFLATVNGYRALAELGPIIDGTRKRVSWLLTMSGLAWNHLRAAGKELAFLRRKFVLEPRTEQQIGALIESRLQGGGLEVDYADLMAVEGRQEDKVARSRLGKETFLNLLWDDSNGNPQIALHFFLRSLEAAPDGSINVRPFRAPSEDELSVVGDEGLFLLAAVMRHNGLDVRLAAVTTAYPLGRVKGLFLHLLDLGAVWEDDGVYRVPTSWRATVLRALRRRNILVS